MPAAKTFLPASHVVDILGSTKGRDQPVMLVERALRLVHAIGDDLLVSQNTVFIDPFCKAGEVLLATALKACMVKSQRSAPLASTEEVAAELFGGRFYGLSPDERHFLLSLRTFYGNERSHLHSKTPHIKKGSYLSPEDGKLNREKFKQEFTAMIEFIKKNKPKCRIVAIGNPPYQEADGGAQASARPIYNFFVDQLIESAAIEEFVLVIPARWFSGGKGLEQFRQRIMNGRNVKTIQYFEKAEEVFPTVQVKGGVCFLHWSRNYSGDATFIAGEEKTIVNLSRYDIIPDDPQGTSVVEKVMERHSAEFVSAMAWARKPFGLATNYFHLNEGVNASGANAVPCFTNNRKIKHVRRSNIRKNADKIDEWKVAIPKAYGRGMSRCTLRVEHFFLIPKGTITTETYNVVGSFSCSAQQNNYRFLRIAER